MGWECIRSVVQAENMVWYGLPLMPNWVIDIDTWQFHLYCQFGTNAAVHSHMAMDPRTVHGHTHCPYARWQLEGCQAGLKTCQLWQAALHAGNQSGQITQL